MPKTKLPQNDFGQRVTVFCAKNGITKKQLANDVGVTYGNLLDAGKGRRAGRRTQEKVNAFITKRQVKENYRKNTA